MVYKTNPMFGKEHGMVQQNVANHEQNIDMILANESAKHRLQINRA